MGDWIDAIAEPARDVLKEPGAVIVRLSASGAECVSRVYPKSAYKDSRRWHEVLAGQLTRHLNGDTEGRNHYAVHLYETGELAAYSSIHHLVREWPS